MKKTFEEILRHRVYYFLIIPALLIYLVIGFYPFIETFQLSFYQWDGVSVHKQFIWFRNYWDIIFNNHVWWVSVYNAAWIALVAIIVQNSVALLLAVLVDQQIQKGKEFYRVMYYLPPMLSVIVVGIVWRWILDHNFGIFNQTLKMIGLGALSRAWLSDPVTALGCVILVICWQGFGNAFLLFLAGLQGIPKSFYEAAEIDGANEYQKFKIVTFPMLASTSKIVSILTVLGTMQAFGIILVMTSGGPGFHTEVPVLRIYKEAFESYNFGYATAMSAVLGAILASLSFVQFKIIKKRS